MGAKANLGVKLPTDKSTLTKKQAAEMYKCFTDVKYFIRNYVYVQHPTKGAVLFDLYDYQERVIDGLTNNYKNIILQPRQSGKTISIVGYLIHKAIFYPDVTIGVAAHKGKGAKEVIGRFRYAYENLPLWMKPAVRSYNVFDIVFDNGSKIMSETTTESTYRGQSLSVLYLDEFAFVKPKIEAEFWKSILPTLSAEGTELIITSTPDTSEGKFADIWFKAESGENDFNPIRVYNEEVPDRGEAFKTAMLKDMSPIEYAQEYDCAFVSSKGTLIQSELLESLRPSKAISTYCGMDLYHDIKTRRIGLSVDVGTGTGKDYSVIQAFDLDSLDHVGEFRNNTYNLTDFTKILVKILKYFKKEGATEIIYTVESNSIGQGVIQLIHNSSDPLFKSIEFISERKRLGILTTKKSKLAGCTKFKDLVEAGKLKINSKNLISELKFFVRSGESFKAESGKHDDLVMGCVIFVLMLAEVAHYDSDVYDNLNAVSFSGEFDDDIFDDEDSDPLPMVF